MRWVASGWLLCAAVSSVRAEPGVIAIEVEAGKTVKTPVGTARDWRCDVEVAIKPSIVTEGGTNYWVVQGRQMGRVTCQVGTDPHRDSFVFDITVTRAPDKKPPAKRPLR